MGRAARRFKRNKGKKTMKVITLPSDRDEAREMFSLLCTATFRGNGASDMMGGRTLGKLQDAMEALGHKEGVAPDEMLVLNDGVQDIVLEDAHCDLLKSRIYGAGIDWVAAVARPVSAAYDLVANAEEAP